MRQKEMVLPLMVKYVQGAAKAIVEARAEGRFTSIENLQERTTKRLVNSRVVGALQAVGALDDILPGGPDSLAYGPSLPVDLVGRSKAINEYLPSLPLGYVQIERKIDLKRDSKNSLGGLLVKLKEEDSRFVMPYLGSTPKFMVVVDSATQTEAKAGKFTESKGFANIAMALHKADLHKSDAYFTGLVKRQKTSKEKTFNNTVLEESFNILKQEIDAIRPPVILCLGSAVSRMFVPTLKGSAQDNALQVHYNAELDCNIVLGFSPGMLHFNPDLEEQLNELFELVAGMVQ
jgi:DNA polymerase-3 subunit alpha